MPTALNHHQQQTAHLDPRLCSEVWVAAAAVLFSAAVAAAAGVSLVVATGAWHGETCFQISPRFTTTPLASQDSSTPKIPWGFIRILAMSSPVRQHEPCPTWRAGSRNSRTAILWPKYWNNSDGKEVPARLSRQVHPRTLDTHVQQGMQDDSLALTAYRGALEPGSSWEHAADWGESDLQFDSLAVRKSGIHGFATLDRFHNPQITKRSSATDRARVVGMRRVLVLWCFI